MGDNINHPDHYISEGGLELWDVMEEFMTPEEFKGYLMGNCIKYIFRWQNKNGLEDLNKCQAYLTRLVDFIEREQ